MRAAKVSLFCDMVSTEALRLALSSTISSLLSLRACCSSSNWEACTLRSSRLSLASAIAFSKSEIRDSAVDMASSFLSICLCISTTRPDRICKRSLLLEIADSEANLVRSASVICLSASLSFCDRWSGAWSWRAWAAAALVAAADS